MENPNLLIAVAASLIAGAVGFFIYSRMGGTSSVQKRYFLVTVGLTL
jgi:hypothetical protein